MQANRICVRTRIIVLYRHLGPTHPQLARGRCQDPMQLVRALLYELFPEHPISVQPTYSYTDFVSRLPAESLGSMRKKSGFIGLPIYSPTRAGAVAVLEMPSRAGWTLYLADIAGQFSENDAHPGRVVTTQENNPQLVTQPINTLTVPGAISCERTVGRSPGKSIPVSLFVSLLVAEVESVLSPVCVRVTPEETEEALNNRNFGRASIPRAVAATQDARAFTSQIVYLQKCMLSDSYLYEYTNLICVSAFVCTNLQV